MVVLDVLKVSKGIYKIKYGGEVLGVVLMKGVFLEFKLGHGEVIVG